MPAKSCPKRKLTQKKLLVTGVVNYSFLKSGQTITADVYCQQLQTMMEKLAVKQPRLLNRSPLLLHENTRPHTAQYTATKLVEVQLECLRHPLYSPDLTPKDYHIFRNLDNFLQGKKKNQLMNRWDGANRFQRFYWFLSE
jgi:[histone H3]-lysine36 N-dimethyltransferase SETMAR